MISKILFKIEPKQGESEEDFEEFNQRLYDKLDQIEGFSDVSFTGIPEKPPKGARTDELIPVGEMVMTVLTTNGVSASLNLPRSRLDGREKKIRIDTKNATLEVDNLSKKGN